MLCAKRAGGIWHVELRREDGSRFSLRAKALVNAAGLYTQYSFPFTLLAQGLLFALWIAGLPGPDRRRAVAAYAALNGVTLALFLPWLPTAWDQI